MSDRSNLSLSFAENHTATSLFERNIRHSRQQQRYLVEAAELRWTNRQFHCAGCGGSREIMPLLLSYGTRRRTTRGNVMRSMARSVAPSVIINRLRNSPLSSLIEEPDDRSGRFNCVDKISSIVETATRWEKRKACPFGSFWTSGHWLLLPLSTDRNPFFFLSFSLPSSDFFSCRSL